jgi:hypothetical protein
VRGHQVRFYALPIDFDEIEATIRALDRDVRFLDRKLHDGKLFELEHLDRAPDGRVEIILERHLPYLSYGPSSGPPAYMDSLLSPILEFDGYYFNGELLRQGRLYFTPSFYDDDGALCRKPVEFLNFADRALKATRRLFKRNPTFDGYVGKAAADWIEAVHAKQIPLATLVPADYSGAG